MFELLGQFVYCENDHLIEEETTIEILTAILKHSLDCQVINNQVSHTPLIVPIGRHHAMLK